MLQTILIFILFLGPLIFFHELGHFLFARFFGVRVETFSIGFGPKLFKFKRGDTDYTVSAIPLGGYVKMFGDDPLSTEELTEDEKKVAYTHKSKWARFWIVFGGPLANFIMAYCLYFGLLMTGEKVPEARIGKISTKTVYYDKGLRSGDLITRVNEMDIIGFDDLNLIDAFVKEITVNRNGKSVVVAINNTSEEFAMNLFQGVSPLKAPLVVTKDGLVYALSADSKSASALTPYDSFLSKKNLYLHQVVIPKGGDIDLKNIEYSGKVISDSNTEYWPIDLQVQSIIMKSPSDKAGMKGGDLIVSVRGSEVKDFEQLKSLVQASTEGESIEVKLYRNGEMKTVALLPDVKVVNKIKVKTIGIYSGIKILESKLTDTTPKGFFESFGLAFFRTWEGMKKTVAGFMNLITAKVSMGNIGGPIAIGKVAADSFHISLSMFFRLMALISINLGIINLFPIPVLDGGHIVFIILEAFNGGPLSRKKLQIAQQFGLSLLLLLIVVALYNDFSRLLF